MRYLMNAAVLLLLWSATDTRAQEPHGGHADAPTRHAEGPAEDEHTRMQELMTGPLGLSLRRYGSGTGWQPPSTPMFGHMFLLGDWGVMLHYNGFAGLDAQGTEQGETGLVGIGWLMGMARGPLLGGQLTARAMLSPEPFLQGRRGYPLLLQTGETAFGRPLVDRQHPHDLFMELALLYNRALGEDLAFELYVAPSGEPALGPVAYPHRFSAFADPLAPIGHHWQDSSHISFGVLTAGLYNRWLKLELSAFNGVEPDEERLGLELRRPDSFSARLTAIPSESWTLQFAGGFLQAPERREPGESLVRLTATLMHNRRLGPHGSWGTTFVWGQNRSEEAPVSNAFLLESSLWRGQNVFFGRAEFVQKTAHDFDLLALDENLGLPVGSLSLGYVRQFGPFAGVVPGIGIRGSMGLVGNELRSVYGTRFPLGAMLYLWVRPEEMGRHMGLTSSS